MQLLHPASVANDIDEDEAVEEDEGKVYDEDDKPEEEEEEEEEEDNTCPMFLSNDGGEVVSNEHDEE